MTLRLKTITFENAPRVPGVRPGALSTVDCDNPHTSLIGWRAAVRGGSLFLISPKGWTPGRLEHDWDPAGPITIHEVPRQHVFLHWEGDTEDLKQITKSDFESPCFANWKPTARPPRPILAQLDSKDVGDA